MKKLIFSAFLLLPTMLMCQVDKPQQLESINQISVDFSVIKKQNVKGVSGANLCWLLDSDKYRPRKRSMKEALKEMGVGALRFPYGALAENYLWTTPPFVNAVNGLTPRIAVPTEIPCNWSWAVNGDGTFKKALDFDEYVSLCKSIGAEPLVVVNVESFKSKNGPSLETLVTSAAEWVKYSNIIKKYNVKYWQLGNEVEHTKKITLDEYVDAFGKIASAMKAVDPTIKVGTGVLGQPTWNKAILDTHFDLVSFVSTHQYTFNQEFAETGYAGWKELKDVAISNIRKTQVLLDKNPAYKSIEMMITETGATGGKWPEKRINDLYKALYWFEMNMEEISLQNVRNTFFWSTHSPWGGENVDTGLEYLLTNKENNTTPTGRIVELVNKYLPQNIVKSQVVSGYLRTYAGISSDKNEVAIFILNKNDKKEKYKLMVSGIKLEKYKCDKIVFSGNSPNDQNPLVQSFENINQSDKAGIANLDPLSLTIYRYYSK